MFRNEWVAVLLSGSLVACSASIPVTKLNSETPPDNEGTLLALPRTTLTVKYNVVTSTFTIGKWTDELETCQEKLGFSDDTSLSERRIRLMDPDLARSCVALYDLGLMTKRPSRVKNADACWDKGNNSETKNSIDPTTLAVTSAASPDPDQSYWVSTPSRWLGDVDVLVKYTSTGSVDGVKASATNPWSDFAVNVASVAIKGAIPGIGAHSDSASCAEIAGRNCRDSGVLLCQVLTGENCKEFLKDLEDLKKFSGELYQAAMLGAGPGFDKQIELFETRVKAQRTLFEGTITTKIRPKTENWIPPSLIGATGPIPQGCRRALSVDANTLDGDPKDAPWSCAMTQSVFEKVCSANGDTPAADYPREQLRAAAWITTAGGLSQKAYASTLEASRNGYDGDATDKDARGFPYRVPVETYVSAVVRKCANESTCSLKGNMTPVAMSVAQYGEIGRLTPRAGGRKGVIEIDYNADTGALTSVQVTGEGSSAKPITDVLQAKLTETEPSALDAIKAEKERVEALASVCKAFASLSAEPPDYCK